MTRFRIKQIGLALCLMMSLAVGHASACTCSHHVENKAVESDCHSHHGSTETIEAVGDADACDTNCICFVEQPSPYAASKSPGREFKANEELATAGQIIPEIEFLTLAGSTESLPAFTTNLSHSIILKSLLPSRAPPRL